jgi:hypothetical protein
LPSCFLDLMQTPDSEPAGRNWRWEVKQLVGSAVRQVVVHCIVHSMDDEARACGLERDAWVAEEGHAGIQSSSSKEEVHNVLHGDDSVLDNDDLGHRVEELHGASLEGDHMSSDEASKDARAGARALLAKDERHYQTSLV